MKIFNSALAVTLLAATPFSGAMAQSTLLDTLVISGGLTPVEINEVGRSLTVLKGEDLEKSQVAYVADALRTVPGLAVSRTGANGGMTQVRIRGAEGNHTLVLIDGNPVSEISTGEFDFGRLAMLEVEHIEILRGPQSAFWGTNAVAGVINIVTKRGKEGFAGSVRTEVGSDGTKFGSLGVSGGKDGFSGAAGLSIRGTDGFNISQWGNELDGAEHINTYGNFDIDITPQLKLDGSLNYNKSRSDTDNEDYDNWGTPTYARPVDTPDYYEFQDMSAALGLTWTSEDDAHVQAFKISGGNVDRKNFDGLGGLLSQYEGDRLRANYKGSYKFDTEDLQHTVNYGYEYLFETFRQAGVERDRTAHSLVGEYRVTAFEQLHFAAALRHDLNNRFEDFTTYSLSAAWDIPDSDTRLHASVGTGVSMPTFAEMYSHSSDFTGNDKLIPESSFAWDIGIDQSFFDGALTLGATYFNATLDNEIISTFDSGWTPINETGKSYRQGIELSAIAKIMDGLDLNASYTYTDATNADGTIEIRRPKHKAAFGASYEFMEARARIYANVNITLDNFDSDFAEWPAPLVKLDNYATVDFGGSYQINDTVQIYGRVENLFDAKYQEVYGYSTQGRTFFAGLKASF